MTSRQRAYFVLRGGSAVTFLVSATALPHGWPALTGCAVAGLGGILTCLGVNAGGPGESAGSRAQGVRYDKVRAPQGDWPPYPVDKIVEGEVLR